MGKKSNKQKKLNNNDVEKTAALCQKTPFKDNQLLLVSNNVSINQHKIRIRVNPLDGSVIDCMAAEWPIFGKRPEVTAIEKIERKKRQDKWKEKQEFFLTEDMTTAYSERLEQEEIEKHEEYIRRSMNRARRNVHDLAACNEWDYFVTLTLNKEKIDRYDYKAAVKKLGQWLYDRVRRNGLKYIGVPEYHKDKALHFHFLTKGDKYKLKDSGRTQKGRKVYNLLDWKIGFSTAVVLDNNREAVAWYIAKYITKQTKKGMKEALEGTIGGRYYFHGGELNKPDVYYLDAVGGNFEAIMALNDGRGVKTQYIEGADLDIHYINPDMIDLMVYDTKTGDMTEFAEMIQRVSE